MATKFAEWYLILSCIFFGLVGLAGVGVPQLQIVGFMAIAWGLAPLFLMILPANSASSLIVVLGIVAIILSLGGLAAIRWYKSSPQWLWVWYIISTFALLIVIVNLIGTRGVFGLGGIVHAALLLVSTYVLYKASHRVPASTLAP